jgi:prepilin-type N-terminal cleavage/methylation domain-containing protein
MHLSPSWRSGPGRRGGFTLLELLVVIGLIGVLVSLLAAGVFKIIPVWTARTTAANLQKMDSALLAQWSIVNELAKDEYRVNTPQSLQGVSPSTLLQTAGGNPDVARNLWIQLRQQQEFPMNFVEATSPILVYYDPTRASPLSPIVIEYQGGVPAPVPPLSAQAQLMFTLKPKTTYVSQVTKMQLPPYVWQYPPDPRESSACLLIALGETRKGKTASLDTAIGKTSLITINNAPVFVDGWNFPVTFFRSGPTNGSPEIISSGPNGTFENGDGDDLSSVRTRSSTKGD